MTSTLLEAGILIIGGGNAGISLAARLHRYGHRDLVLVEPKLTHHYRPLLSYVGAGRARPGEIERPQQDVMPRGVRWLPTRVTGLDPQRSTVTTADGHTIAYDHVVVCPGSEPDWSAAPGSAEAVLAPGGSTNYLVDLAPKTWRLVQQTTAGTAVFTVPDQSAPCPQAGQKILYMACDHWRRTGVLDDIDVVLATESETVFGIGAVDRRLESAVEEYGITVHTATAVTRVDAAEQSIELTGPRGVVRLTYDMLHLTPRYAPVAWVREAGLHDPRSGFVEVDPETLRHRRFPNVWACGDVADVAASKSGGALRKQTPVLARNLTAARKGRPATARYNGYSVSPVTTSMSRALVAEYDRDNRLTPSVPFLPLLKPSRALWTFDRHVLPFQYWHSILKGR